MRNIQAYVLSYYLLLFSQLVIYYNRYRTELAKKSFHYTVLNVWNEAAAEIRELPILDRFIKQLKTHLLN